MPCASLVVCTARVMPRPGEQVLDLADGEDLVAGRLQAVEQRRRERRQREIPPVGGARERAGEADERPGDDAADAEADARELEGDLADTGTAPAPG